MFDIYSPLHQKEEIKRKQFRKILNNMKEKKIQGENNINIFRLSIKIMDPIFLQWKTTIKDIVQNCKDKFIYNFFQWHLFA